jgi:hypothetical protein
VSQSLAVLEEAGLSELQSIRDLQVVSVNALTQNDVTDYRSLCAWSQTPAQWRAAVLPMDPSSNCKLYGKTEEEAKTIRGAIRSEMKKSSFGVTSVAPPPADHLAKAEKSARRTKHRLKKARKARSEKESQLAAIEEQFGNWWATMLASDAEINMLSTDGYQPKVLGEGPLALFEFMDKVEPPPPLRTKTTAPGAMQPAMSKIAALALGCAAQPKERKTFERSFGRSVWFMQMDKDKEMFGTGPAVNWPKPKKGERPLCAVVASRTKRLVNRGPKAVVMLHPGGIGCDIGLATWQRLFAEHRLDLNGRPKQEGLWGDAVTHFMESKTGRYVPRAIFAHTDENALSDLRQSKMFDPRTIFKSDKCSRSDIVMRELKYNPDLSENLRVQLENIDSLGGIVASYGLHCPVGSWLAFDAFSIAASDSGKVFCWSLAMGPSPSEEGLNNSLPEPPMTREECFTTLWSLKTSVEFSSMVTLMDRRAIAKLVASPFHGLGQEATPLGIAQAASKVVSGFTSPLRVGSQVNASIGWSDFTPTKVTTNLIPYPNLKFTMPLVSPLQNQEAEDFERGHSESIVQKCFNGGSLLSVDTTKVGKLLSAGFWCRGVHPSTALDGMAQLRHNRTFRDVDYIPGNVSIGSQPDSPTGEQDVVALMNHTGIYSSVMQSWGDAYRDHYSQGEQGLADDFILQEDIAEGAEQLWGYVRDAQEVATESAEERAEE